LLTHFANVLIHFSHLLSQFSVFRKQKGNLLSQTAVCLLISVDRAFILVFSASKKAICFLKLRFAYSFQ